jgi:hypothetical protein
MDVGVEEADHLGSKPAKRLYVLYLVLLSKNNTELMFLANFIGWKEMLFRVLAGRHVVVYIVKRGNLSEVAASGTKR